MQRAKTSKCKQQRQSSSSAAAAGMECYFCKNKATMRCGSCYRRVYCSKECQLVDWRDRGHKEACKTLAAAHKQTAPTNTNTARSAALPSPWASMKCDFCSGPAVTGH
ncbi:unnamed protein product [Vitrella brassicaformis CCMP3155]|uniref:MYND-type domain-containing protein n=1 Tax=Vitrella brassicaformis (strain CCMP3155) TaxID=1169540 RepID=A0A0G4FZL6_VITBC|nr:unnamed protein product [Vitrella brassicaformis CCMP3155]|eukprot:CEM20825.1 unnamed protein product [Vitrella brassicaformis CCMP3155]